MNHPSSNNVDLQHSTLELFGLPFFAGTVLELQQLIIEQLQSTGPTKLMTICTPNPEQVVQTTTNARLLADLRHADLLLPDGIGIVWASWIMKATGSINKIISSRITGADLVSFLLDYAYQQSLSVLVIGGRDYADKQVFAARSVMSMYEVTPAVITQVAHRSAPQQIYWLPGYSVVQHPREDEETVVREAIKAIKPQLVFVAFGAPDQEKWLTEHRALLEEQTVRMAMSVGGTFDFLTKKVKRAPIFLQTIGLEWLYRLYQEPWRWQRQLRLLSFISLVFKHLKQS